MISFRHFTCKLNNEPHPNPNLVPIQRSFICLPKGKNDHLIGNLCEKNKVTAQLDKFHLFLIYEGNLFLTGKAYYHEVALSKVGNILYDLC